MKRGHVFSILLGVLLLASPAGGYELEHHECYRPNDEESRLETARRVLGVTASDWEEVVYYWADQPVAPPDGEGAIYKETVLTNFSRQEMADYLEAVFALSPDMEMVILDELFVTHENGTATYMATNQWSGNWQGYGRYVQPGMSIIKFEDPASGCVTYQRDYFTEGDTWWGVPQLQPLIRTFREEYIKMFGLTERCFDEDGDGYSKYNTTGCPNSGLDCNDYDETVYPGAIEICDDGIDNNCSGLIDCRDPACQGDPACPLPCGQMLPPFGSWSTLMKSVSFYLALPLVGFLVARRLYRRKGMGEK